MDVSFGKGDVTGPQGSPMAPVESSVQIPLGAPESLREGPQGALLWLWAEMAIDPVVPRVETTLIR